MSDRGPNQDLMPVGGDPDRQRPDAKYRDASYLGTSPADDEEVHDLGFIVDDHDDRRDYWLHTWERAEQVDTDEALETNRSGPIPGKEEMEAADMPQDRFATDFHVSHADAEEQEEDFVETSMMEPDPEMNDGTQDYTNESLHTMDGDPASVLLSGQAPGAGRGLGTTLAQDIGAAGFSVHDNPLMQPQGTPIPDRALGASAVDLLQSEELPEDEEEGGQP